jgi:bifunctional ADP-heptose synthase (sugar kinase/adenylyltransferase)
MLRKQVDLFIDKCRGMKVAVIGETITDEFVFVTYEGPSMKSLCPALKLTGRKETHQGGAAAIANHLRDFVKLVDVISNPPDEIIKTRYVDANDGKKHVEINSFNLKKDKTVSVNTVDYDVVIVADFGHGFSNNLSINDGFHLMCQTNSNNFGFNRISKWKKHQKKSVCIDLREASLQLNKKAGFDTDNDIDDLYNYELNAENLFITTGSTGALHYNGQTVNRQPAFKSIIADTIGAGDTFFGFVSLATAILPPQEMLIVPSLAASLSTTWLGNAKSVTKDMLKEYATKFI